MAKMCLGLTQAKVKFGNKEYPVVVMQRRPIFRKGVIIDFPLWSYLVVALIICIALIFFYLKLTGAIG